MLLKSDRPRDVQDQPITAVSVAGGGHSIVNTDRSNDALENPLLIYVCSLFMLLLQLQAIIYTYDS